MTIYRSSALTEAQTIVNSRPDLVFTAVFSEQADNAPALVNTRFAKSPLVKSGEFVLVDNLMTRPTLEQALKVSSCSE